MDLTSVASYRRASSRDDLALAPGETYLAGGTWVFSEPNRDLTGLVDIMTMPWEPIEWSDAGLRIGATCTIARLLNEPARADAPAMALFAEAANALLASFKIWNEATVVGNICRAYAAGAMTAALVTLDATAEIWEPDGGVRTVPVAQIPVGNGLSSLATGEVVRAVDIPAAALAGRTALHKVALAELGRSGAVVTGRIDASGTTTLVVTAATYAPHVARFDALPSTADAASAARQATTFYTDALGSADWRHHLAGVLAERVVADLAETEAS